jgi:hypothetical protein
MKPSSRNNDDRHARVMELADRCANVLSPQDWESVAAALSEMRDQLLEDIPDQAAFTDVFEDLVASLIDRLGGSEVASWDQARIYSQSGDRDHRERAAAWIARRRH